MVRRFVIQTAVAVAALTAAALLVAGCGSGENGGAQASPSGTGGSATTTTAQPTPGTTTSPGMTATPTPAPDVALTVDVTAIEAAVYADIATRSTDVPVYPGTLDCGSGSVAVGSALRCSYVPDEPLEFGGPFVVVLGPDRIVWTTAPCCDAAPWPDAYPAGAFCRDLAAPPPDAPREMGDGVLLDPSPDYHLSYGLAVWYWYAAGRPDRMDADLDGIPCETVYDADEIADFWGSAISLG